MLWMKMLLCACGRQNGTRKRLHCDIFADTSPESFLKNVYINVSAFFRNVIYRCVSKTGSIYRMQRLSVQPACFFEQHTAYT